MSANTGLFGRWPREELLDEWVHVRDSGCTELRVAAARIGVSPDALQQALRRARKAGDPRGGALPFARDLRPRRRRNLKAVAA